MSEHKSPLNPRLFIAMKVFPTFYRDKYENNNSQKLSIRFFYGGIWLSHEILYVYIELMHHSLPNHTSDREKTAKEQKDVKVLFNPNKIFDKKRIPYRFTLFLFM